VTSPQSWRAASSEWRERPEEFNAHIVEEFRRNRGSVGGHLVGIPLLLLTSTGRRTGQPRTTPLIYLPDGDRFIVFATNAGRPTHPHWYHNLVAEPRASVDLGYRDGVAVRAEIVRGQQRDALYARQAQLVASYQTYPRLTDREIPVVALCPAVGRHV
jgi:deazaflavin-dependent oxidoreductase (nitroreductase family)